MNKKIIKYMEDFIFLNKRRYISAMNKFVELQGSLLSKRYLTVEIQGSFGIRTAIKPIKETDEYDLDVIIMIPGEFDSDDNDRFQNTRNTLIQHVNEVAKDYSWGNYEILEIKKGIRVEFKNELHFDIVPVFSITKTLGGTINNNFTEESISQNHIYDFEKKEAEESSPFKLAQLIKDNIDINKRILLMIIKKIIQNNFKKELKILPSIGSAYINTVDLKNKEEFTISGVIANLKYIIANKKGPLINPYVPSEEFYTKNGYSKESWKEYLTALDSLKLTLQKIDKNNDFEIFVKMIEKGIFVESNGVEEETGSGGHA